MTMNDAAGMPAASALLVKALLRLSDSLDGLIASYAPGDPARTQLEQAQTDLANAANDIDADALAAAIATDADLQALASATQRIEDAAAALAKSQAQVTKIVTLASSAVALGNAVSAGSVAEIVAAVSAVKNAAT